MCRENNAAQTNCDTSVTKNPCLFCVTLQAPPKRYSSVTQALLKRHVQVHALVDALVHGVQELHLLADCIRRLGFDVGQCVLRIAGRRTRGSPMSRPTPHVTLSTERSSRSAGPYRCSPSPSAARARTARRCRCGPSANSFKGAAECDGHAHVCRGTVAGGWRVHKCVRVSTPL